MGIVEKFKQRVEKAGASTDFERKYGISESGFKEAIRSRRPFRLAVDCFEKRCLKERELCIPIALSCLAGKTGAVTGYHVAALVSSVKKIPAEQALDAVLDLETHFEIQRDIPTSPEEFSRWLREPGSRAFLAPEHLKREEAESREAMRLFE